MGRSKKKTAAAAPASTAAASNEPADKSAPDVGKGDCDEPADKSAPDVSVGDDADAPHQCEGGSVVIEHDGGSGSRPNDDTPDDMKTELVQPALVDAGEAHPQPCGLDHAAKADHCMEAAQGKDGQGESGCSQEGAHPPSFTSVLPDQSEAVSSSVATPQDKMGQRAGSAEGGPRRRPAAGRRPQLDRAGECTFLRIYDFREVVNVKNIMNRHKLLGIFGIVRMVRIA